MASAGDVARLRRLTNEPTDTVYTNIVLGGYIDSSLTVELAAAEVWREKAARYAGLVDTTEGSSSRKMSQLRDAALKMAELYGGTDALSSPLADDRPRSRAIVRG